MQQKQRHLRKPAAVTWQTAGLAVLLALAVAGKPAAAPSPYEIAIDDLDQTGRDESPPVKKPVQAAPARHSAVLRHNERFVRYTIRPGDHIYKILTVRFGLSSTRAEALIPRIKEINGIGNTSRLQIGQSILLPVPVDTQLRKRPATPEPPALPETPQPRAPVASATIIALPEGEAAAIFDAVLTALAIAWQQDHAIIITVGPAGGSSLSLTVDRYFEYSGTRYFVDFSGGDTRQATLVRLLEIAGYRRIALVTREDRQQAAETLLHALGITAVYGKHAVTLTPVAGSPTTIHLVGYLVGKPAQPGDQVLFTLFPPESAPVSVVDPPQPDQQPATAQSPPAQQPETASPDFR